MAFRVLKYSLNAGRERELSCRWILILRVARNLIRLAKWGFDVSKVERRVGVWEMRGLRGKSKVQIKSFKGVDF